jgi:hypothetical protein
MSTQDADEVRSQHLRDMGQQLGSVYHALWKEVVWLHVKWKLYCQLYAKAKPKRVDLLKQAADHFFGVVYRALGDDVLLHLSRLTDEPQGYRRQENLTIKRLATLAPKMLKRELRGRVKAVDVACKPMRDWRNTRGAHTDLHFALSEQGPPGISRAQVDAALQALCSVMSSVATHHGLTPTSFDRVIPPLGDADSLVFSLMKGIRAEDARRRRLLEGKPLPEDFGGDELP